MSDRRRTRGAAGWLAITLCLASLGSCVSSRGFDICVYNETTTGALEVEIEGTAKDLAEGEHKFWFLDREGDTRASETLTVRYRPSGLPDWASYSFSAQLPDCQDAGGLSWCRRRYDVHILDSTVYHQ